MAIHKSLLKLISKKVNLTPANFCQQCRLDVAAADYRHGSP
jgi:hypothetical protein